MGTPAAVGVNDDFSSGQACIALRTSNDEFYRGIDVQMSEISVKRQCRLAVLQSDLCERFLDNLLNNEPVHLLHGGGRCIWASVPRNLFTASRLQRLGVLRGNDNSVD